MRRHQHTLLSMFIFHFMLNLSFSQSLTPPSFLSICLSLAVSWSHFSTVPILIFYISIFSSIYYITFQLLFMLLRIKAFVFCLQFLLLLFQFFLLFRPQSLHHFDTQCPKQSDPHSQRDIQMKAIQRDSNGKIQSTPLPSQATLGNVMEIDKSERNAILFLAFCSISWNITESDRQTIRMRERAKPSTQLE